MASMNCIAQTPQLINYQAVARDASGGVLASQAISVRFNIRNTTASGPIVFSETHSVTTNQFGLFNLMIGSGTPITGTLTAIDWAGDLKFLQVRMDINNGNSYSDMGTQQLISVPYSLASAQASALSLSATVQPVQLADGGATVGQVLMWDGTSWIPATTAEGTIYTAGDGIDISGGVITNTGDLDNVNEIQSLSLNGSQINLSNGGGSVLIPNIWISTANNGILNPNIGNVAINPITFAEPSASLDVYRGTGPDGTAAFRGTTHVSHFNYGANEDTYIRGGLNNSPVYINDIHAGNVNIATGGGGLGIGVNANLSYKAQLFSNFGRGMRLDVTGTGSGTPEGLGVSVTSVSSYTKFGVYSDVTGLGNGDNLAVFGNAAGAATGYKIGVKGQANGTGSSNSSIGVQGLATSAAGSENYGVQGFADANTGARNYGTFGSAVGSTDINYGAAGIASAANGAMNIGVYGFATGSTTASQSPGNSHLEGSQFTNSHNANFGVFGDNDNPGWAGFFDGDVYAFDVFYQSSDSVLKSDVQDIPHGISTVKALRPVSYKMKESPAEDAKFSKLTHYGFIAQEVSIVLPELVTSLVHPVDLKEKGDDRTLLALNYDGFIPVLTSAIQEQQAQIELLQNSNEELKQELNALRALVNQFVEMRK